MNQNDEEIHACYEYVFDLELPTDFVPKNNDGEVKEFQLFTTDEVLDVIKDPNRNCGSNLVALDFLIRKGIVHYGIGVLLLIYFNTN